MGDFLTLELQIDSIDFNIGIAQKLAISQSISKP